MASLFSKILILFDILVKKSRDRPQTSSHGMAIHNTSKETQPTPNLLILQVLRPPHGSTSEGFGTICAHGSLSLRHEMA